MRNSDAPALGFQTRPFHLCESCWLLAPQGTMWGLEVEPRQPWDNSSSQEVLGHLLLQTVPWSPSCSRPQAQADAP